VTQSDSAGSTSHRGQSLISTIALLASARYFALIGRRHGELGRVVRKLQLVRCERGSKARRAAVASSWLFKWRQPTVVRRSRDANAWWKSVGDCCRARRAAQFRCNYWSRRRGDSSAMIVRICVAIYFKRLICPSTWSMTRTNKTFDTRPAAECKTFTPPPNFFSLQSSWQTSAPYITLTVVYP